MPTETQIQRCEYCGDEVNALPGLADLNTCSKCDEQAAKHDEFRRRIEARIDSILTIGDAVSVNDEISAGNLSGIPSAIVDPLVSKLRKKAREIAN